MFDRSEHFNDGKVLLALWAGSAFKIDRVWESKGEPKIVLHCMDDPVSADRRAVSSRGTESQLLQMATDIRWNEEYLNPAADLNAKTAALEPFEVGFMVTLRAASWFTIFLSACVGKIAQ